MKNSINLDLIYLPHLHTASLISNTVGEILMEWGLDRKVLAITTDNGANLVKAMGILVREGKTSFHNRCAAHSIQLLVNIAVKNLKSKTNKSKKNSVINEELENESFAMNEEDFNDEEKEHNLNTIDKIK